MAKKSSTQITVTVTGDGINATYSPAPAVNAATAPGAGPVQVVLAAATPMSFGPAGTVHMPVGSVGILITHALADLILGDGISNSIAIAAGTMFLPVTVGTAFVLFSAAGGNVLIQWV